jgi:HEPN domain-containing protein
MKGDPSIPANWYKLARRDLDKGRKDLSEGEGPYAVIQFQQAVEKACKGWLIANGWRLVKTHDLVFLLGEIKQRGLDLSWFASFAGLLSKEYFEERYVSWDAEPTPTLAEIQTVLADVEKLFSALGIL